MEQCEQTDLTRLNSLALASKARVLVNLESAEELAVLSQKVRFDAEDILILGGGSNLVLPPFLDRLVLRFLGKSIVYDETSPGEFLVKVDAGMGWDDLVSELVGRGLCGVENLSLIPGSVGAAPVQNIGAYGVELADVLDSVEVFNLMTGHLEVLSNADCCFAYRDSVFKQNPGRYFIVNVRLKVSATRNFTLDYGELEALKLSSSNRVQDVRNKVIEVRQAKLPDPKELPNAGSFFKNPVVTAEHANLLRTKFPKLVSYPQADGRVKLAAGWLLENAGWKGYRDNGAGMHHQQALVLVNYAQATQADVLALADKIKQSIQEKFQVQLEIEPVVLTK